jgi:hypothetical protein
MSAGTYIVSSAIAVMTFVISQRLLLDEIVTLHALSSFTAIFASFGMVVWWFTEYVRDE